MDDPTESNPEIYPHCCPICDLKIAAEIMLSLARRVEPPPKLWRSPRLWLAVKCQIFVAHFIQSQAATMELHGVEHLCLPGSVLGPPAELPNHRPPVH